MAAGSPSFAASDSTSASPTLRPASPLPLVGGGLVSLGFFAVGLLGLAAAAGLLFAHPHWLRLAHFHPRVVAFVHLWLPGGLVAIAAGACYQLMPVVLGEPLRARRLAPWWHLGLHAGGITGLAAAFAAGRYDLAVIAGAAVAAGAALLHGTAARTFIRSSRRDAVAWSLPLSTGWLALTTLSGLVLAWNRHRPFLPLDAVGLLRAHAHLGLVGFFGSLLQGVTFQILPMFVMGELRRPRLVSRGLVLSQAGLALFAIGLAAGGDAAIVTGAGLTAAAFACSGAALVATWRSRRKRRPDAGVVNFLAGAAMAAAATVLALALAVMDVSGPSLLRAAMAYGVLLIGGALPLMLLGMLGKILPFLVWMRAYGPLVGSRPVPLAGSLGRPRLESLWGAIHVVAILVVTVGVAFDLPRWLGAGCRLLAAGLGVYLINASIVFRHLVPRKHRQPAAGSAPCPP